MTIIANNFYGLWMQDIILTPWKLAMVVLVILFMPTMVSTKVLAGIWLFLFLQLVSQRIANYKSRKLGLNFFILAPGPAHILNYLLAKHDIYVSGGYTELHVLIKKYPDMKVYNDALLQDAKKLKRLAEDGKLTGNLVLNTFNRQAVDVIEGVFSGASYGIIRRKKACLTKLNLTGWKIFWFRRNQRKMFGRVLSERDVGNPDEWELLVVCLA